MKNLKRITRFMKLANEDLDKLGNRYLKSNPQGSGYKQIKRL